jgi:hypothetical protein
MIMARSRDPRADAGSGNRLDRKDDQFSKSLGSDIESATTQPESARMIRDPEARRARVSLRSARKALFQIRS